MNIHIDSALASFCQRGLAINVTTGQFCLFRPEGVYIMQMTVDDYEKFKRKTELQNSGIRLKQSPTTAEEKEYKRLYDYMYSKERALKKHVQVSPDGWQ